MRMRRKKHLEERTDRLRDYIILEKPLSVYRLKEHERYDIINPVEVFGNDNPVYLELGCGKGSFLAESALRNPDKNYFGVEVVPNVVVAAAEKAAELKLKNVRFLSTGAQLLHYILPESSVSGIYLNFSSPFPKKQYANSRLTYWRFLEKYRFVLKSGGWIKLKTDNVGFFDYSLESLQDNGFDIVFKTYDLYAGDVTDNIQTEYEKKFLKKDLKICALTAIMKN